MTEPAENCRSFSLSKAAPMIKTTNRDTTSLPGLVLCHVALDRRSWPYFHFPKVDVMSASPSVQICRQCWTVRTGSFWMPKQDSGHSPLLELATEHDPSRTLRDILFIPGCGPTAIGPGTVDRGACRVPAKPCAHSLALLRSLPQRP